MGLIWSDYGGLWVAVVAGGGGAAAAAYTSPKSQIFKIVLVYIPKIADLQNRFLLLGCGFDTV